MAALPLFQPFASPPPKAIPSGLLVALSQRLGSAKLLSDEGACAPYASDDSDVASPIPGAVVLAENAADVSVALELAAKFGVALTPRAGGTGRTGGAVPLYGGIVLATHRLNQILEIDRENQVAVVQPGVVLKDLQWACEQEGLFYPPDPSSQDTCCIGGNVAENAGGPRAFKYGTTRDYVLGLDVTLMGGTSLRTGKRTVKGVTGYDVTSLLVGSEGTLGVFTSITLRLVPKPPDVATVLALFRGVGEAADAVAKIVAAGLVPRCLELLDATTLDAVRGAGVSIDPRARAMLLIEADGSSSSNGEVLERLGNLLESAEGIVATVAAADAASRDRLWQARRAMSKATRKLARYKLSEDVVVPRSRIKDLLNSAQQIEDVTGVRHLAYGHAGDGNLHVNFLWDDPEDQPKVHQAISLLMQRTIELGGTLSGEHGIGVTKAEFLPLEQSEELIRLQQGLKGVFDPKGLLNPGKIFPRSGHRGC